MIYMPTNRQALRDAKKMAYYAINGWNSVFDTYSRFYHIGTESIKDYMMSMGNNFDCSLTVGASGDQGIACTQRGAKDVYFFDINRADIYYLMLHKVALSHLKRKDLLEFLVARDTGLIMDHRIYKKLSEYLPEPIKIFWDIIYDALHYNSEYMADVLFRSPKQHASKAPIINDYYTNNKIYYDTQEKIKKCNWHFIESDFYELDKNLPDDIKFDAIILSNLYEYLNFGNDTSIELAKKYVEYLKKVIIPKLQDGGSCMAAYLCRYDDNVNNFIKQSLEEKPNGWVPSMDTISGLDKIETYMSGYTGQNVSYHYLLDELKDTPIQKVLTPLSGYGYSSSKNDMAIIYKK